MAEPPVFRGSDERALPTALAALDRGEIVVVPTDTVFGVAGRPELPAATAAIFDAKSRPRDLTLPVLVPSLDAARSIAVADERSEALAPRFWPGPLTLVLPRSERSLPWELGSERRTIAVRVPDHPLALDLLRRSGPLATTSANLSGRPTPADCDGVRAALGAAVAVYLCGGPPPAGTASTVVDLTGDRPRVLREGALPASVVLESL